jgi:Na+-driven multidrug efflux pump
MGVQSSLFSLSNIFITSAVNTFSTEIISARSIANSIDQLLSTALASYSHASMTFVGQNYGAKDPQRIKKSVFCSVTRVLCVGLVIGTVLFIFKKPIALLYIDSTDPLLSVILSETEKIMSFMLYSYLFHGVMNSLAGTMRGLGYSFSSMFINLIASCILRVLYIVTVFPAINDGNIIKVYVIYPISWFAACLTYSVFLLVRWKKIKEKCNASQKFA